MMFYNDTKKQSEFIDFRETAPSCSSPNMAQNNHSFVSKGGLSVAIPGELKAFQYLSEKYSNLSWSALFKPTIDQIKSGIKIDETLSIAMEKIKKDILYQDSFKYLIHFFLDL